MRECSCVCVCVWAYGDSMCAVTHRVGVPVGVGSAPMQPPCFQPEPCLWLCCCWCCWQVNERQLQERRVITSVDYTHILGRRASPLTNGMATGIFLVDSQPPPDADPDWLPFHW